MMKGQLHWGRCSLLQALVVVAVAWLLPLASSSAGARQWAYTDEAVADEVVLLPGAEELNVTFRQFSGYIEVGGGKQLHYWLVESQGSPEADPLVFWTNGGPGCSGLLGFFTEMGPFRPTAGGNLTLNPYSWNLLSSMVFMEAPVGVGFSFAEDPDDYRLGDAQTAIDNYHLIQGFLSRFPQFRANELYLASESYGGHYMPTLAHRVLVEQARLNDSSDPRKLNFKGFMVGNPFTSWLNNWKATYEAFWGRQLVALPTYALYRYTCAHIRESLDYVDACLALALALNQEVGPLNPYALDYPVCLLPSSSQDDEAAAARHHGRAQRSWLLHYLSHGPEPSPDSQWRAGQLLEAHSQQLGVLQDLGEYEPCLDNYLVKYLNRADVKAAIHVRTNITWTECSAITKYDHLDMLLPMEHYYTSFVNQYPGQLRILVYSGDADSVCATWGTQQWVWGLGLGSSTGAYWESWDDGQGQLGGHFTQFDGNLTLVTVHGAGHEVPTYKPSAALELFRAYLNGTWFDTTGHKGKQRPAAPPSWRPMQQQQMGGQQEDSSIALPA